jgi:hypothetical protein
MRINEATAIKNGWKKDARGNWHAPVKETTRESRRQVIEETNRLGGNNLGMARQQTKNFKKRQYDSFKLLGLSEAEAALAAGVGVMTEAGDGFDQLGTLSKAFQDCQKVLAKYGWSFQSKVKDSPIAAYVKGDRRISVSQDGSWRIEDTTLRGVNANQLDITLASI